MKITIQTVIVTIIASVLVACSREQSAQTITTASVSATAPKLAIVIGNGTNVNIGGRMATVYGHEDSVCGGPIEFWECKVVKVEAGKQRVTLVVQNTNKQQERWEEDWQITEHDATTGQRFIITRPDGTIVRSMR